MARKSRFGALALFLCGALAAHADWPQFRGPGGQGHAPCPIPVNWDETRNVVWKTPIPGKGWSSPVIADGVIWMTTATDEGEKLRAVALDEQTGKFLKDILVFEPKEPATVNAKNSHASPSPVLSGGRLYLHFGTMGTACLDAKSGEILWRNESLTVDHKEGPGSSPIVWGDRLIVNCDGIDKQYIACLSASTGEVLWKSTRPGPHEPNTDFRKAYSTPLAIQIGGVDEIVSTAADQVIAYAPSDGREIWKVRYKGFSNVPRPVFGDGLVFICTGYMRPQIWALRPEAKNMTAEQRIVWKYTDSVPANPSPILVGDEILFINDAGILTCLEAKTGKLRWKKRVGGNYSASPILAGEKLYLFSEAGATTVYQWDKEPSVVAKNAIEGRIMATPAINNGVLFLRSDTALYRIEESRSTAAATR